MDQRQPNTRRQTHYTMQWKNNRQRDNKENIKCSKEKKMKMSTGHD